MSDKATTSVEILEPLAPSKPALPPEAVFGLGQLSTSQPEAASRPEPDSLLELYRFSREHVERTQAVVAEAAADPKVHRANHMLYVLAEKGSEHAEFVEGLLVHQRDVAELAVATALEAGITDQKILGDVARAGLTHDGAKGKESRDPKQNLAAVFMHKGIWNQEMRETGEAHPTIEADVQRREGLSDLVQYLTGLHHTLLRENPERHIKAGGYGGTSIIPPSGERGLWEKLARIFAVSDDVAANTRKRGYKDGMTPADALGRTAQNLVPDEGVRGIIRIFQKAAGLPVAA